MQRFHILSCAFFLLVISFIRLILFHLKLCVPFFIFQVKCVCSSSTLYSVLTLESHPFISSLLLHVLLIIIFFFSRIVSSIKEFLVYRFFFPLPSVLFLSFRFFLLLFFSSEKRTKMEKHFERRKNKRTSERKKKDSKILSFK